MDKKDIKQIMEFADLTCDKIEFDVDSSFNNPFIDEDYWELFDKFYQGSKHVLKIVIHKRKYPNNLVFFGGLLRFVRPADYENMDKEIKKLDHNFLGSKKMKCNSGTFKASFFLFDDGEHYNLTVFKE